MSRKKPLHKKVVTWVTAGSLGFAVTAFVLLPHISPPEADQAPKPLAPGSTAALIEKHDCWTGEAPPDMKGRIPGHAVVTYPGAEAPTYGGPKAAGEALDHVFEGKHPDLTVHAFCR